MQILVNEYIVIFNLPHDPVWLMFFIGGASGKDPPTSAGDVKGVYSIPGLGRFPGGGHR